MHRGLPVKKSTPHKQRQGQDTAVSVYTPHPSRGGADPSAERHLLSGFRAPGKAFLEVSSDSGGINCLSYTLV